MPRKRIIHYYFTLGQHRMSRTTHLIPLARTFSQGIQITNSMSTLDRVML